MTESKKEDLTIPSLKEFIFPSQDVKQYVEDLSIYHQFSQQSSVELYEKWKGKDTFSGSMEEYRQLRSIRELLDKAHGKDWQYLIKTIYLLDEFSNKINIERFHILSDENQLNVLNIISKGQKAFEFLTNWIKPINKKNVLEAIYGCTKVSIGKSIDDDFQVLKFKEFEKKQSTEEFGIYPDILEIENPDALIDYIKNQKDFVNNTLIMTFMNQTKYDYKTTVLLFLIWDNTFYILNMSEGRLNINNTEGARTGGARYVERYDNIWLPFDIFMERKKKNKKTDIVLPNQKIFKRGSILKVFEKSPAIKAWCEIFLIRIRDYIETTKRIAIGTTSTRELKALEDKSQKIEVKVKTSKYYESFESVNSAGDYLLEKYSKDITAVILAKKLPMVVGDRKFVQDTIRYANRDEQAKLVQKLIIKDFKKNHKRVYKWFHKFLKKLDVKKIIETALLDKEYSVRDYEGKKDFRKFKPIIIKKTVMQIDDSYGLHNDDLEYGLHGELWIEGIDGFRSNAKTCCVYCNKIKWKQFIILNFIDYRQICEFFNIDKSELPKEFVEHLHQQNETYVGNSILSDTDPMDEIQDWWFRGVYDGHFGEGEHVSGTAQVYVKIPVCNKCIKQIKKKND